MARVEGDCENAIESGRIRRAAVTGESCLASACERSKGPRFQVNQCDSIVMGICDKQLARSGDYDAMRFLQLRAGKQGCRGFRRDFQQAIACELDDVPIAGRIEIYPEWFDGTKLPRCCAWLVLSASAICSMRAPWSRGATRAASRGAKRDILQ